MPNMSIEVMRRFEKAIVSQFMAELEYKLMLWKQQNEAAELLKLETNVNNVYIPTPKDVLKDNINGRTLIVKEVNIDTIVFIVQETGMLVGENIHYVNNKLIVGDYTIVNVANNPNIKRLPAKRTMWQKIKSVFTGKS